MRKITNKKVKMYLQAICPNLMVPMDALSIITKLFERLGPTTKKEMGIITEALDARIKEQKMLWLLVGEPFYKPGWLKGSHTPTGRKIWGTPPLEAMDNYPIQSMGKALLNNK